MLSELIQEIEERFRLIIREEIRTALMGAQDPSKIQNEPTNKREYTVIDNKLPSLLIAKDVAEILGVNVQRVYELVRTRKVNGFPVVKIGERQYRFNRKAILEWINRESQ